MFSGIVEEMATVVAISHDQENIDFTLKCSFVDELKIDQSISHNGVCLTVVRLHDDTYTVTAMKETLERSNLRLITIGDVSLTTKVAKKFHTSMKESFDFVRHSLDVMNIPIYSLAE